jgi:Dolichyl-phosphate-mannose-protein mannosyltransferase
MNVDVMLAFTQAIVVMTLLGFFVIELLLPPATISRRLVWALAPAVGAGICSFIVFLFRRPMFTVERGLLLVLICWWVWKRRPTLNFARLWDYRIPILNALLFAAILVVMNESVRRIEQMPHGGTDAYAIWNSHARYLFRDGQSWQQHIQNTYLPDYPLLLPTLVARVWRYSGDVPDLGGLLGLMFPLVAIAVLGTTLAELRGSSAGILVAFTLLTTSLYMVLSTHQEADVPLSAFNLCTVALIYLYFERAPAPKGLLILAGFLAGCAAWTKNEGILFLVATSSALVLPVLWKPRATLHRFGLFLMGVALPLAVLAYFKIAIAPGNYLVQGRQFSDLVDKVMTLDRHAVTFRFFLSTAWSFGKWTIHPIIPLLAFLVWRGFDRPEIGTFRWRTAAGIILIVLVGYYWIYVITPIELPVHLESSLSRLLVHVWPSVILMIGLAAKKEPQHTAN